VLEVEEGLEAEALEVEAEEELGKCSGIPRRC
jgi:hypothetical protein